MSKIILCNRCKHNKDHELTTFCGAGRKDYPNAVVCPTFLIKDYPMVPREKSNDVDKPKIKYISTEEVYCKIYL